MDGSGRSILAGTAPGGIRQLPPFPGVAARLMRLVADVDAPFREVTRLLQMDAALAAEVLRLANSPVFGFRYQIRDVPHAAAVLGLDRIRGLVMTLVFRDFLAGHRSNEALRRCWHHNFACALTCETFAPAFWIEKGLAYTAGLLHDVGLLALVASHPQQYEQLLSEPVSSMREFCEKERALFGADHCQAGEWILAKWDLPPEFREVAARHHEALGEDSDLCSLVQLGCELARAIGFPAAGDPPPWNPEQFLSQLSDGMLRRLRERIEDLPITIATRINAFDCDFLA